jgi:hypothetical protein
MNRWIPIIIVLLIGIALGILIERQTGAKRIINLRIDPSGKKVLINPQPDDILVWREESENVTPTWTFGKNPCEEKKDGCHIKQSSNHKVYSYKCKDCTDPEVPVGTEIRLGKGLDSLASSMTAPFPADIGCDENSSAAVEPKTLNVSKSVYGAVKWFGIDDATQRTISNWRNSATGAADVCEAPVDNSQPVCKLKPDPSDVTYSYDINVNACGTKTGTFQLKIQ